MADDLQVNSWLVIPGGELRERFSRSSGPGGQSVNTADSRVELSFDLVNSASLPRWARERAEQRLAGRLTGGVITVTASEHRNQLANRQAARARLAALLREAVAPPGRPRVPTRPSRGARERRLESKRHRSEIKRNRRARRDPELTTAARQAERLSTTSDRDHDRFAGNARAELMLSGLQASSGLV